MLMLKISPQKKATDLMCHEGVRPLRLERGQRNILLWGIASDTFLPFFKES